MWSADDAFVALLWQASTGTYWSQTAHPSPSVAWAINLNDGGVSGFGSSNTLRVWPVRVPQ